MPVSTSGRGSAGSLVVTPSLPASHSTVEPCSSVEITTAKNTMLKKSCARPSGTFSITANVASTTGTAPRSPAHPSTMRSRALKSSNAVATATDSGRATNTRTSVSTVPSTHTSPSALGKTSRPRARNIAICATQASPSWKTVTVCFAGIRPDPSTRPAR